MTDEQKAIAKKWIKAINDVSKETDTSLEDFIMIYPNADDKYWALKVSYDEKGTKHRFYFMKESYNHYTDVEEITLEDLE